MSTDLSKVISYIVVLKINYQFLSSTYLLSHCGHKPDVLIPSTQVNNYCLHSNSPLYLCYSHIKHYINLPHGGYGSLARQTTFLHWEGKNRV